MKRTRGNLGKWKIPMVVVTMLLVACQFKNKKAIEDETAQTMERPQNYGEAIAFLTKYMEIIELSDSSNTAKVAIAPALQGRVMTSTAKGPAGQSFGWLNYELIESGEVKEHFNPIGGEERFWLGPEGGQYSIYFKPGTSFEFDNWYVPKELDTEPFDLIDKTDTTARFKKHMQLLNHSGTPFDLKVDRTVKLLGRQEAMGLLGVEFADDLRMVGFETENTVTNTGGTAWDKTTGMLSIWILSMLNPSDGTTVIVPFRTGDTEVLGEIVTDYHFGKGKISPDRLRVLDSVVLFKADGRERGKIGISPKRALPFAGSYDAENEVLTVAAFSLPEGITDYVNSLWEIQDAPFAGDAVNSYNDGPLENNEQLGPFYELESSSPAAHLAPDESITHVHRTFHFKGEKTLLDAIALQLFGLPLEKIKL